MHCIAIPRPQFELLFQMEAGSTAKKTRPVSATLPVLLPAPKTWEQRTQESRQRNGRTTGHFPVTTIYRFFRGSFGNYLAIIILFRNPDCPLNFFCSNRIYVKGVVVNV